MKRLFPVLVFSFFILLDQITKTIFSSRDFFIGFLHIHSVKNYGLAFSFNFGPKLNLILIVAALLFFFFYLRKTSLAAVLIVSGALSNVADRVYFGYVRDFLDLGLGFTFNIADVLIVIGLILVFLPIEPTE